MIIKTKKYQLPKKTYIQVALMSILKKQWWFIGGPILLGSIAFALPAYKWWFIVTAILVVVLYILFWAIQFVGVTQLPQNQIMFDRLSYEIDSRQIMIKVDPRRGSPIAWDLIKEAYAKKDHFVFMVSKAQIIYLPYKIFNSDYEVKFVETILKRKEFIKAK